MRDLTVYGFDMARVSEVYLSTLSAIMKPHGLERYFFPFLFLCENSGKITQNEMAQSLHRDKVSTMRIVDYLCEQKLLQRKTDKNDRRCHILHVTDKARKLLPKVQASVNQTNEILFRDFSKKDREIFAKGMDRLITRIDAMPEPAYIIKAHKRKKN